jgi:hypothetical protein
MHPLHFTAEHLREEGTFLEALKTYTQVLLQYEADKNHQGLVEVLRGVSLTYRH